MMIIFYVRTEDIDTRLENGIENESKCISVVKLIKHMHIRLPTQRTLYFVFKQIELSMYHVAC